MNDNESNAGIFRKENSAVQSHPIHRFFSARGSLSTAVPTEDLQLPPTRPQRWVPFSGGSCPKVCMKAESFEGSLEKSRYRRARAATDVSMGSNHQPTSTNKFKEPVGDLFELF